jgi:hypothetical protein
MLLNEILDNIAQVNSTRMSMVDPSTHGKELAKDNAIQTALYKTRSQKTNDNVLGAGVEAIVFQSKRPQDAGVVTKWLRNQISDATNNSTIKMLTEMQKQNSTYFPKVYSIKQHNLDNGMFEFVIKMEKLYKDLKQYCVDISDDDLMQLQLINQILNDETSQKLIDNMHDDQVEFDAMMTLVFRNIRTYHKLGLLNPQFKKSLVFVRQFSRVLDLHLGNFMIRLTNVGPQLVIVDPIMDPGKFFKDMD